MLNTAPSKKTEVDLIPSQFLINQGLLILDKNTQLKIIVNKRIECNEIEIKKLTLPRR